MIGFAINANVSCNASNLTIANITHTDGTRISWGAQLNDDGHRLTNIFIDNVDNSGTASNAFGCRVSGDNNNINDILITNGSGTGLDINSLADKTQIFNARSTSNGTNFTDNGTNSTYSVEDT